MSALDDFYLDGPSEMIFLVTTSNKGSQWHDGSGLWNAYRQERSCRGDSCGVISSALLVESVVQVSAYELDFEVHYCRRFPTRSRSQRYLNLEHS